MEAVAVAQVLEEKTEEYQEALIQSIIIEPVKEFKIAVIGAIDLVDDTSQEAMEVIVEKVVSGEVEVSRDEVIDLVEKKIEKAKAKVEETKVKLDEVSVKIEEVKDATPAELEIKEINTGTFCFDSRKLFLALTEFRADNAQGEYYLTDTIEILKRQGHPVFAYKATNYQETLGINTAEQLLELEKLLK